MDEDFDPITYYEVNEELRVDVDEGLETDALEDGDDTDRLDEVFANPGPHVTLGGE
jgi:hypothetical protein